MMAHGFDPAAQYTVSTWRGIEHGTRTYKDGESVTATNIPATVLYTLYRFGSVRKADISVPKTQPQSRGDVPAITSSTPSISPRERLIARLDGLSYKQLKKVCEEKGLNADGDKADLRDRILSVVE